MAHGPLAYSLCPMVHWPIVYTFPTAWSKAHGTASVLCASLMVVTNTNFGAMALNCVLVDVTMYWAWFSQTETLVPERTAADPDVMDVIITVYIPCVNRLVYVFNDLPQPAVALMCSKNIQQPFSATLVIGFDRVVDWLKVVCHRKTSGVSSILATNWSAMHNDDIGLRQWGKGMHNTILPPLPAPTLVPVTPTQPGLTESEARAIAKEVTKAARETESTRARCRGASEPEKTAPRATRGSPGTRTWPLCRVWQTGRTPTTQSRR